MANKILPVADALKQLYQSLGGDDPEVLELSTNTELIQEIAKVAEGGGGSGLPEVTAADNGKVLGVDDGEWKAVTPLSGLLEIIENEGVQSIESTYAELNAILSQGLIPYYKTETGWIYRLFYIDDDPADGIANFISDANTTSSFFEEDGHLIPD